MKKKPKKRGVKPGQKTKVYPIRTKQEINKIRSNLLDKPRDLCLFNLCVNNGLRAGDILNLKVKDVRNVPPDGTVVVREQKTNKENYLVINKLVHQSLHSYLAQANLQDDDFLFPGRFKNSKPLTYAAMNNLVKRWCKDAGLTEKNYGTHSLRKAWGYLSWKEHGIPGEVIMKRFNHSSWSVTRRYLMIPDREVQKALMLEI